MVLVKANLVYLSKDGFEDRYHICPTSKMNETKHPF